MSDPSKMISDVTPTQRNSPKCGGPGQQRFGPAAALLPMEKIDKLAN